MKVREKARQREKREKNSNKKAHQNKLRGGFGTD